MSNRSWYTNGIDELQVFNGEVPPEGFYKGRKPITEETRKKISASQKGHPIYRKTTNKGMIYSEQACKNMSDAKKRFLKEHPDWISPTSFVKGQEPWNIGIPMREESKRKLSQSNKGRVLSEEKRLQKIQAEYATKKKNHSFNTSKSEDRVYNKLVAKFGTDNVIRQYRDENRYPFYCDFYIKSDDLFIECNFTWSHGGHLFDCNSVEDCAKKEIWKEKAKSSKYYELALKVWTERDVIKHETIIQNNLNAYVAYKEVEIDDFLSKI